MDVIQSYSPKPEPEEISLVYLAKPIYGGWVTFTVHLVKQFNYRLYKVAKRTEKKMRTFGYGVDYQNVCLEDLLKLPNLMITAVDKHYWEILPHLPPQTKIVIHDPTELKTSTKNPNPLVQNQQCLQSFKVFTIRETVQKYLIDNFKISSEFKIHPFYRYPCEKLGCKFHAVTISRVDFDKNTDIILKANQLVGNSKKRVHIFGAENRLYVHHKLGELDFYNFWKGKFEKEYPLTYQNKDILKDTKFVVDMSTIKNDGGGSQYTFLEAIYQGCILILHREWVKNGSLFKEGINCLAADTPEELAKHLQTDIDSTQILKESQKLLTPHLKVKW
jgi:hypothetical protein